MTSHLSVTSPARTTTGRGAPRVTALLATAALALAGCGGDAEKKDPQGTANGTTMSRTSPLTGEVLDKQPGHPILAVKIDNSGSGRQVGLGKADMVVEELVEGGITRLATFYYSRVPSDAGPVRSMRTTDIGIVAPLKAVLVASGGAAPTWKRVREADIKTVSEGGRGYYRGPGSAPYNLFMDMNKLVAPMKPLADVPKPYLPFGDQELPQGKAAKRFTVVFSQASDSSFQYRRGGYVNTDGYAPRGDDFVADTVLVLRVRVGLAGYRDPSGFPVPETKFTGRGPAQIFHKGRVIDATWVKEGLEAPVTLRGKGGKGDELELSPGQVRIALVPQGPGSVRVG
jgi:hypothetical protein